MLAFNVSAPNVFEIFGNLVLAVNSVKVNRKTGVFVLNFDSYDVMMNALSDYGVIRNHLPFSYTSSLFPDVDLLIPFYLWVDIFMSRSGLYSASLEVLR